MTLHWSLYGRLPGQIQRMPLHGASRSKVGMPLCQSFLLRRPQCLHQLPLSRSWDLLREPLSVAHTAGEHVRELESSGAFSCLKTKPVYAENAPSRVPYAGESTSTRTDMRPLPRKGVKNEWKDETRHIGLAVIPPLLLQAGLMRRVDTACLLRQDRTAGETNYYTEEVTWKDTLDRSAHFLCKDRTS